MDVLLYVIAGIFGLIGVGTWLTAAKTKHVGHLLGGFCYVSGATVAVFQRSWLPLLIGYGLAFVVRRYYGDPHRASSDTSRCKEFKEISIALGGHYTSIDYNNSAIENKEIAENRLFILIESDPEIKSILARHGASKDTVKRLYEQIILAGAGQWAGSEWVPAAGIATPYTLSYLLSNLAGQDLKPGLSSEEIRIIAWNVLNYFKTGESLPQ